MYVHVGVHVNTKHMQHFNTGMYTQMFTVHVRVVHMQAYSYLSRQLGQRTVLAVGETQVSLDLLVEETADAEQVRHRLHHRPQVALLQLRDDGQ